MYRFFFGFSKNQIAMETYTTQRFDGKIEAFDSCMIDATNQQQDIPPSVSNEVNVQDVSTIEAEENNEVSAIQQVQAVQQSQISQIIQPNAQNNVTLTPVRLPAILDGEFFSVMRLEDTNVTARCLQCHKLLNGNLKSTGNFLSHIKVSYNDLIVNLLLKIRLINRLIIVLESASFFDGENKV